MAERERERERELMTLPADLPIPVDDGACDHLVGLRLPDIALRSTRGRLVNPARQPGVVVVYCYPRTGRPDRPIPADWDAIPGARGCTPQNCSFRDQHAELESFGASVYGMSTQTPDYQLEMAQRLALPHEVLSDAQLAFTRALRLPTFDFGGETLVKRLSIIARDGTIQKVFYPVFPSDSDASNVVAWLRRNA